MSKRALIVVRLSNLTEETTSPERQREVCERFCADRGWTVVGTAEDLDVSASTTSPFDRPQLRKWLNRPEEYDVIVFWRVDRLVRRVTHLARMIEWSEQHDVNLISATEAHFDLSTSIGQALAIFVGVFAQMESDATSERTSQTFAHNIKAGKYRGGYPPFGYQPVDTGGEWRYAPDPVTSKLARDIVARVLDGERPTAICRDLNNRGVPTPQDHFRAQQGKPCTGAKWRTGNLVRALQSPTLLGQVVVSESTRKNGRKEYSEPAVLRGDDGAPIVRSTPILDRDTFERLQKALEEMNGKRTPYKKSQALLLRVIHCGVCERPMYYNRGRTLMYYRCSSASYQTSCGNPGIRVDTADEFVTELLMHDLGDVEMTRRVYDPGEDNAAELAEIEAELVDVAGLIGTGPYRSGPARAKLEARADALDARRTALEASQYRPAGYRYEPTGKTFRQHWEELDLHGRNLYLRDHGVRLDYRNVSGLELHLTFGELLEMVQAINPEHAERISARLVGEELK
ncbi:recombinase family protein [Qaidamihabitans albus]|uniref:recombinase family protein n=1 Tax=Qaidamihabitans albus TaxID=2795733 RepID=UPI0018F21AE2|nr:recombinase family protein [Qaidamihabitans albus]